MPINSIQTKSHSLILPVILSSFFLLLTHAADPPAPQWPKIPEAEKELAALAKEIEAGRAAAMEWRDLIGAAKLQSLDVLTAIPDHRKYERGKERGLRALLNAFPAAKLIAHVESLPTERRPQLLQILDRFTFYAPETTRRQMTIFYGLGQDRRALYFSRRYWGLSQSPLALQFAALACRRGDLAPEVWEQGGQHLYRRRGRGTKTLCRDLSFYIGLAEALNQSFVVPHLLQIAAPNRPDPVLGRLLTTQLFRLGYEEEVPTILSGTDDPVLVFHMLRLFNKQLEQEMTADDWERIIDTAENEADLLDLAEAVNPLYPKRAGQIYDKLLTSPPTNSRHDLKALQILALRAEQTGRYKDAAKLHTEYVRAAKGSSHFSLQEQQALLDRAAALQQFPEPDTVLLSQALRDRQQGRTARAIQTLKRVRSQHPELVPIHLQLVRILADSGQAEDYSSAAAQLLTHPPLPGADLLEWARYAVDTGQTERASDLLTALSDARQAAPTAVYLRGRIALQQNELDRARDLFSKVMDRDPGAAAHIWAGLTEVMAGNDDPAIDHWTNYMYLHNPEADPVRLWLHLLRRRQNSPDESAYRDYLRARGPDMSPWDRQLAGFVLGDKEVEPVETAADTKVRQIRLQFTRGWKALRADRPQVADQHFRTVTAANLVLLPEHWWAQAALNRMNTNGQK